MWSNARSMLAVSQSNWLGAKSRFQPCRIDAACEHSDGMEHDAHAACAGGATSLWRRIAWSLADQGLRRRIWRASTCAEPSFSRGTLCNQTAPKLGSRFQNACRRSARVVKYNNAFAGRQQVNDLQRYEFYVGRQSSSQLARPNAETAWEARSSPQGFHQFGLLFDAWKAISALTVSERYSSSGASAAS